MWTTKLVKEMGINNVAKEYNKRVRNTCELFII